MVDDIAQEQYDLDTTQIRQHSMCSMLYLGLIVDVAYFSHTKVPAPIL